MYFLYSLPPSLLNVKLFRLGLNNGIVDLCELLCVYVPKEKTLGTDQLYVQVQEMPFFVQIDSY